ncbi:CoB--CoM heterodisulfide reductase iron-sulfur subunit B family protein [Lebetimonas sp. JH292]|uniref:CoB--CoM heterodisulfide reductase iron-sulfur subunit B family protein n=1 Tax=Lebetimonas sp. JH292 TaxID=990068 RepID=UPI000463123A|nr:CoB--CoM heterodisulfide reductase iron-sulfur subunit B family protein [Lebetimonas sp. JH292]
MKKIGIYPGCCFQGADVHNYDITVGFLKNMGIEGILLDRAACCGGGVIDETNKLVVYGLNARNIALAEEKGVDLYTPCNTCYMVIAKTKLALDSDPELKEKVNKILSDEGLEYKGEAKIYHTLNLIRDFIGLDEYKKRLKREISGVKVAPYYGCHVLAPNEVALDDVDNPTILKEILEPLGVEVIEGYKNENTCCGYHASYTDKNQKERLAIKPLEGAKEAGADIVATPCPLCHKAMDGKEEPILQVTQLINVACGMSPDETGINLNKTEVKLSI